MNNHVKMWGLQSRFFKAAGRYRSRLAVLAVKIVVVIGGEIGRHGAVVDTHIGEKRVGFSLRLARAGERGLKGSAQQLTPVKALARERDEEPSLSNRPVAGWLSVAWRYVNIMPRPN